MTLPPTLTKLLWIWDLESGSRFKCWPREQPCAEAPVSLGSRGCGWGLCMRGPFWPLHSGDTAVGLGLSGSDLGPCQLVPGTPGCPPWAGRLWGESRLSAKAEASGSSGNAKVVWALPLGLLHGEQGEAVAVRKASRKRQPLWGCRLAGTWESRPLACARLCLLPRLGVPEGRVSGGGGAAPLGFPRLHLSLRAPPGGPVPARSAGAGGFGDL